MFSGYDRSRKLEQGPLHKQALLHMEVRFLEIYLVAPAEALFHLLPVFTLLNFYYYFFRSRCKLFFSFSINYFSFLPIRKSYFPIIHVNQFPILITSSIWTSKISKIITLVFNYLFNQALVFLAGWEGK